MNAKINRKKHKKITFALMIFSLMNLFCQEENSDLIKNEPNRQEDEILGIWENGGRFIEFTKDQNEKFNMRIVLKPYYRFVYDDVSKYTTGYGKLENSDSQFYLKVNYTLARKAIVLPVCVERDLFFTSFYKKFSYTVNQKEPDYSLQKNPLEGFWIEQGNRNGVLLYAVEVPKSIDAYFFSGESYIKFRYWLDDLAYNEKKAVIRAGDGNTYEFPKLLKRGELVYSCITSNGKALRNFETGTFFIKAGKNEQGKTNFSLTLNPQGSGPGTHSVADTYPHPDFPVMENLPLYLLDNNSVFAFGAPYLLRSKVSDLDAEIKKHNKK